MSINGEQRQTDAGQTWVLLVIFVAVLLLWNTAFISPLKILVVFFHELSHGIAAVISGGRIMRIEISILEGGLTYTAGGNHFLIASAGYIGSMLWGASLILSARFVRRPQIVTFFLGLLILLTGLVFVRPFFSFGMLFCLLSGALLLFLAGRSSPRSHDLLLKVIGITSCMYAILDIKSDVLDRPHMHSDAVTLQQLTLIPSIIWGILWIAISIVCTWFCLRLATKAGTGVNSSYR
jgi:hypothetical protein